MIELTPGEASFGANRPGCRVKAHPLHARQVDDHAVITDGIAGDVVTAPAHGHQKLMGGGELDGGDDIGHACAADNESGPTVDHAVKHLTRGLIARIPRAQKLATQAGLQHVDTRLLQNRLRSPAARLPGVLLFSHGNYSFLCSAFFLR